MTFEDIINYSFIRLKFQLIQFFELSNQINRKLKFHQFYFRPPIEFNSMVDRLIKFNQFDQLIRSKPNNEHP